MDEFETLTLFPEDDGRPPRRRLAVLLTGLAVLCGASYAAWSNDRDAGRESERPSAAVRGPSPSSSASSSASSSPSRSPSRSAREPYSPYVWAGANKRSIERWLDDRDRRRPRCVRPPSDAEVTAG